MQECKRWVILGLKTVPKISLSIETDRSMKIAWPGQTLTNQLAIHLPDSLRIYFPRHSIYSSWKQQFCLIGHFRHTLSRPITNAGTVFSYLMLPNVLECKILCDASKHRTLVSWRSSTPTVVGKKALRVHVFLFKYCCLRLVSPTYTFCVNVSSVCLRHEVFCRQIVEKREHEMRRLYSCRGCATRYVSCLPPTSLHRLTNSISNFRL